MNYKQLVKVTDAEGAKGWTDVYGDPEVRAAQKQVKASWLKMRKDIKQLYDSTDNENVKRWLKQAWQVSQQLDMIL